MHAAAITVNSTVAMYSQVIDPVVPGASPPRPRGARECMRLRLRQAEINRHRTHGRSARRVRGAAGVRPVRVLADVPRVSLCMHQAEGIAGQM